MNVSNSTTQHRAAWVFDIALLAALAVTVLLMVLPYVTPLNADLALGVSCLLVAAVFGLGLKLRQSGTILYVVFIPVTLIMAAQNFCEFFWPG